MPLSTKAKRALQIACGQDLGSEIVSAIAGDGNEAAVVAAFGATTNISVPAVAGFSPGANLVGVDGTGSNAAPLAGTETRLDALDTAVDALVDAVNTCAIASGVETRLDNLESKVNAILTALKDAGLMATS